MEFSSFYNNTSSHYIADSDDSIRHIGQNLNRLNENPKNYSNIQLPNDLTLAILLQAIPRYYKEGHSPKNNQAIWKYLHIISLVCKEFNGCLFKLQIKCFNVFNYSIRTIFFFNEVKFGPLDEPRIAKSKRPNGQIAMLKVKEYVDKVGDFFKQHGKLITHLTWENEITFDELLPNVQECPNLKSFRCRFNFSLETIFNQNQQKQVLTLFKNLELLHFPHVGHFPHTENNYLAETLRLCPEIQLRSLNLLNTACKDETLDQILVQCPGLEFLSIGGNYITNIGIDNALSCCKNLKTLVLSCSLVRLDFKHPFKKHCNLQFLHIGSHGTIEDDAVKCLMKAFPNLHTFKLSEEKISYSGLIQISLLCKNLQVLDLRSNTLENNDYSVEFGNILDLFPNIKYLDLSFSKYIEYTLNNTLQSFPNIQILKLDRNIISDSSLEWVINLCQNLKILSLKYTNITEIGLKNIFKFSSNLRSLSINAPVSQSRSQTPTLRGSKNINGESLKDIDKIYFSLQSLDLSATGVTDIGLMHILKLCPQLQSLKLDYTEVTDKGLVDVGFLCPKLQSFDLVEKYLVNIPNKIETSCTTNGLQQLWDECPNLRWYYGIILNDLK